jgi:hypothetical protein
VSTDNSMTDSVPFGRPRSQEFERLAAKKGCKQVFGKVLLCQAGPIRTSVAVILEVLVRFEATDEDKLPHRRGERGPSLHIEAIMPCLQTTA